MRLIVVATDGSEGAARAVALAADIARRFDATLHIVHVLEGYGREDEALECRADSAHAAVFETRAASGGAIVRGAREQAQALGVARLETETRTGPVAETIMEIARDEKADAIVVGKRGHGRLAGLVLGSVSQKIACEARCPVVIAP
jgi:nucleotide-binding universal stress UspA family protein